jgi:hypothetical protein
MIVNYKANGWQIIAQRSHGLLAAQICARWQQSDQLVRWVDTLIATAEHDDVFNELESGPLVNAKGGPIDFKMTNFDEHLSSQLINRAEMKGSFIALLVYRHIAFTHGNEPKAKKFLSSLQEKEKGWLQSAHVNKAEVDRAYELLEFCDALSLIICQEIVPPEGRRVEISRGPSGTTHELFMQNDCLVISPWPFEVSEFNVDYECRYLDKLTFPNDKVFRSAFEKADVVQVSLKFKNRQNSVKA